MPRMRGLSDAVFYRPTKTIRYQHIDALFGGEIDWDLIATHAQDMFQVPLSIQAGRVMPSMLLRKLGSYSAHSASPSSPFCNRISRRSQRAFTMWRRSPE
jgi:TnpA family transposase